MIFLFFPIILYEDYVISSFLKLYAYSNRHKAHSLKKATNNLTCSLSKLSCCLYAA